MATKKKLLQAAAGNAGGAAAGLNVEDVFSTYLYEGNGSSQAISNGIRLGQSGFGGSAYFDGNRDFLSAPSSTDFAFGTGDFTLEHWVYGGIQNDGYPRTVAIGPTYSTGSVGTNFDDTDNPNKFAFYARDLLNGRVLVSTSDVNDNAWHHVAITRASGVFRLFIDGVLEDTNSSYIGSSVGTAAQPLVIGSVSSEVSGEDFSGYISNFRIVKGTAVYTSGFTPPTEALTAISGTELLTCQGDDPFVDNSSNAFTITQNGDPTAATFGPFDAAEAGEGGLVWLKGRNNGNSHFLHDSERTITKFLQSQTTAAEQNTGPVTSFNYDGFSLGYGQGLGGANSSGDTFASWTFRKAPKFFDVVTYTGDGSSSRNISHALGTTVGMLVVKSISESGNWFVLHREMDASPAAYYLLLNSTTGIVSNSTLWGNTAPTDSVFTVGGSLNDSGRTYIAYLFAHNDGDGEFGPDGDADIIKCGSYTGTGADGNFVDLGFEPQWLLLKRTDSAEDWPMADTMRGFVTGGAVERLRANSSAAEISVTGRVEPNPTGFTLKGTSNEYNASSGNFIYIAIRRGTKVPESGTEVFAVDQGINSSAGDQVFASGFPVDLMIRTDPTTTYNRMTLDRLRGSGKFMNANGTGAESDTAYAGEFDDMTGIFTDTGFNFANHYAWMWKRAPNYFDVVAYEGNSTAGRAVNHNLGVAPEMMWVKARNQNYSWYVYHKDLGATKFLELDGSGAENIGTLWTSTPFTDSAFYLNGAGAVNGSGSDYIAYLFASLDGISKVGSYTGNGATGQTIDCGFTSGARFVLIKETSSANDWYVYDSERGITSSADPYLKLNTADAEATVYDGISPASSGFHITQVQFSVAINRNGADYIFYAIA